MGEEIDKMIKRMIRGSMMTLREGVKKGKTGMTEERGMITGGKMLGEMILGEKLETMIGEVMRLGRMIEGLLMIEG